MRLDELRHSKEKEVTRYWRDGQHVPDGYKGLRRNFYQPGFRPRGKSGRGAILGTTGDWLKEMGATVADIAPAREKVLQSKEYQRMLAIGFEDTSTPGEIKAGTIRFLAPATDETPAIERWVHLNGNIRTVSSPGSHHAGRGDTFHPMTAKSHPDMSPVDRIAGSMRRSIDVLVRIHKKAALTRVLNQLAPHA